MAKFPEAQDRLFKNKFVCRKCKAVIKTSNTLVLQGKVSCRRCGCKSLRTIKKK